MPGVRAGGAGEYERALRQEYEAIRERLQARLDQTDEPLERQALVKQLQDLKGGFEKRMKGIGRCLFGTQ
jgi:hypothetical protein